MPHDLPAGKTVYHYFRLWKLTGVWERAMNSLREQARQAKHREKEPSAAIIDSQSIKTSPVRGIERGFDAGKKIFGRKRHILVDTQGFLLAVKVHTAALVDRRGAPLLLEQLKNRFPRLCHLFADHGYTGPLLDWIKEHLGWETEIVPRPQNTSHLDWVLIDGQPVQIKKPKGGFQVQRKRWIVERTFAWKWACSSCESSLCSLFIAQARTPYDIHTGLVKCIMLFVGIKVASLSLDAASQA